VRARASAGARGGRGGAPSRAPRVGGARRVAEGGAATRRWPRRALPAAADAGGAWPSAAAFASATRARGPSCACSRARGACACSGCTRTRGRPPAQRARAARAPRRRTAREQRLP